MQAAPKESEVRTCFMIIPGIGGHPDFHHDLISGLEHRLPVYSWPHGDFFTLPYRTMEEHLCYWAGKLNSIEEDRVVLVGISFGAHIAASLIRNCQKKCVSVIYVSYWPIESMERLIIRLLGRMPVNAAAWLVGESILSFSSLVIKDRSSLQKLRAMLYDRRDFVRRRLLARLLCLRSAHIQEIMQRNNGQRQHFIYGTHEFLLRLHPSWLKELRAAGVTFVLLDGSHAVSVNPSAQLVAAVFECI